MCAKIHGQWHITQYLKKHENTMYIVQQVGERLNVAQTGDFFSVDC